ncbi:hypothetical protein PIIN_03476 [Serendipita indica DSM 11827]|uniref:VWFA domain-containing protein n=1 Tax=Serendipita indica (strain DSM 11827) TaxID=1109443 RepID=G4TDZ9_SERID|nr:hypothetical protein PIIN_03476 [Serendipita indica DSM 11827]
MSSATWDLLLVTDATASMGTCEFRFVRGVIPDEPRSQDLDGLAKALPEIICLGSLSGAFSRVGLLAYRDYDCGPEINDVIEWSGWDNPDIVKLAKSVDPRGGGDVPEACKTALNEILKQVDTDRRTLVIWYADAGPHHSTFGGGYYSNRPKEEAALLKAGLEKDWVKLCMQIRASNCTVFSIVQQRMQETATRFFALLSGLTDGTVFTTPAENSVEISQLTLDLLLAWMGEKIEPPKYRTETIHFQVNPLQASPAIVDEEAGSQGFLPRKGNAKDKKDLVTLPLKSLEDVSFQVATSLPNLSKRFLDPAEKEYRGKVNQALHQIISHNVLALTYNPIFGQLWRAVCKDRLNPYRDDLVNSFSNQVGKETDPERRKTLTEWLEESYNSEQEITELVEAAPKGGPRVYLDLDSGVDLTRTELLEVARSLYPGVLKKLASILTHLKVVEEDVTLLPSQRYLPLSLKPFDLFKVLPHLVVPGTMFSGRAAALFAALSMVVGVPFLDEPARELLNRQKGTWLDIEIPENLSFECAKLLTSLPPGVALTEEESAVYKGMRRYRLIELNLKSSLSATVPWTPEKTSGVGDLQITCSICKKRRSVTIMAEGDTCGPCAYEKQRLEAIAKHVKGAKELALGDSNAVPIEPTEQESKWVECSVPTCRAQYVVLRAGDLRVRPKCHYCRHGNTAIAPGACPWVACTRCSNRIILPEAYRTVPSEQFLCFACSSGKKTLVDEETNTLDLVAENGSGWLGFDPQKFDIFKNSSAFKLFSKYGASVFIGIPTEKELTLHFKKIFNADVLRLKIEGRVETGEVEMGTCALCFDDTSYHKLLPACGRSGCKQQVDEECLQRWYGENKPGRLLNPLQLACPFCRRPPVRKILIKHNPQSLTVGDLRPALTDRTHYYAWCLTCGFAKPAIERACADAGLPQIRNFMCQDCKDAAEALQARLRAEAEALQRAQERTRQEDQDAREAQRLARLEEIRNRLRVVEQNRVVKFQQCPNKRCGIAVEKVDGCNHITCR